VFGVNICCCSDSTIGGENGGNGGSGGDGVGDGDGKLGGVARGNDETGVSFVVDWEVHAGEAAGVCFVGQLYKIS
jgi:hypothetical protein